MCLSMTVIKCTKQQLNNIWSSVHEKVKQHLGWVEKNVEEKRCFFKKIVLCANNKILCTL